MRIGLARAEHDERLGEQRHQAVGVRVTDRLIDLGDETLGVLLGLALVDGRCFGFSAVFCRRHRRPSRAARRARSRAWLPLLAATRLVCA